MSESPMEESFERQLVDDLLTEAGDDLRRNGWDVAERKAIGQHWVPKSILRFAPDIVARRKDELVVIQAMSRNSRALKDLDGLAQAVAEVPNARLETYWLGDARTDWPSRDKVRSYAHDALALLQSGHAIGAVATAWAAVEGALAYYVSDLQISIPPEIERRWTAWQVIAYLDSLGYISERDLGLLNELRRQRNAVMHFVGTEEPDAAVIEAVLGIVERMVVGQYVSLDQMMEWFIEHYDYPDVPVGDADRARIRALLIEHFPSAPDGDITDVVSAIVHDAAI